MRISYSGVVATKFIKIYKNSFVLKWHFVDGYKYTYQDRNFKGMHFPKPSVIKINICALN